MAIADTINSMYENVGEVYDTITNVDLPTNKNIENIPSTIRKSYLDIMNNGIDTIYDNWEKVNGTGTSISLNNTEEAPMTIEYKGNTSQGENPTPTTPQDIHIVSGDNYINVCGKNLLKLKNGSNVNQGVTITINNNKVSFVGTPTRAYVGSYTMPLYLKKGTYTFSSTNGVNQFFLWFKNQNDSVFASVAVRPNPSSVTINEDAYAIQVGLEGLTIGTACNVESYFQLEKGTTATDYEPYQSQSYELDLGKNLANPENLHLGYSLSEQGALVSNNPARTTLYQITIEPNKQYNLSANANYQIGNLFYYDISKTFLSMQSSSYGSNKNITTPNNAYYISFVTRRSDNSTMTQNDLEALHLQIEKGDTVSSFAPYKTPIELCKIGTYQDRIFKSSGKNLVETIDIYNGFPVRNIGSVVSYQSSANSITYKKCAYVGANKTYTLSWDYATPKAIGDRDIIICDENNIELEYFNYTNNNNNKKRTFTPTYNGWVYASLDTNAINVMLNEESIALPYEPYGKDWYLNKQIGKVVLDGTEQINYYSVTQGSLFRIMLDKSIANIPPYSNYFKGIENSTGRLNGTFYYNPGASVGQSMFDFVDNRYANVDDFKNWLVSNNVSVYYILATPTYEKITGELLNQLEIIKKSYENQTNINQENNDLPFELEVGALEKY